MTIASAFLDSDVIISSAISQKGTAYLLTHTPHLSLWISNVSTKEIVVTSRKLKIAQKQIQIVLEPLKKVVLTKKEIEPFNPYVTDRNDMHIVAGATKAKVAYLISYNQKHYKKEAIQRGLDILVLTPAMFLQYLRSRS